MLDISVMDFRLGLGRWNTNVKFTGYKTFQVSYFQRQPVVAP
jgi:hypothetical protein